MSFSSLNGSSHKIKGSFDCSSASSTGSSMSFRSGGQKSRINKSLNKRRQGDMIKIERTGFLHYAIYIGKDKVVDFVADNGGEVSERDLYETVGKSECAIDNYLDNEHKHYSEKEIVRRALLEIPEDHVYDLGRYNCEHFATWCRYGIKYCHQPCEVAATLGTIVQGSSLSS